jgi:multisubunit Na+/H+ antiporter MnhB subunit
VSPGPPGVPGATPDANPRADPATSVMARKVARLLLLPALLVAAGILLKGYAKSGDGFSAGVVAALGILLQYLAFGREEAEKLPVVRHAVPLAFVGLLASIGVAAAPLLFGDAILTHYPPPGSKVVYLGTLELITAVLFDVGVFLLVFGFAVGTVTIFARAGEAGGGHNRAGTGVGRGEGRSGEGTTE